MARGLHRCGIVILLILIYFTTVTSAATTLRVGFVDTERNVKLLTPLVQLYEAAQRGASIELVPVSQRQFEANLPRWLLTGETADVYLVSDPVITALKGQGVLRSMLEFRWPGFRFEEAFRAFPQGIQQAFSGPHGPLGVPLTADAKLFQVNTEMFADAGVASIGHITENWNWHDMIDVGRRISIPSQNRYMLHLDLEFAITYFLVHGDVISTDQRSSRVENRANVGILKLAQEAIHRYGISPVPSQQTNTSRNFRNRLLAMRQVDVLEMQPQALNRNASQWSHFDWDVAPWPLSPFTNLRPALGVSSGLVVSPVTRALPEAEALLRVAISDAGQRAVGLSGAGFPARIDLWESIPSNSNASPQNRKAFALTLQNWKHFFFPQSVGDLERLASPILAVLEGTLDPESGLGQAHRMLDERLKQ